jgi:hypothetical protein
MNLYAIIRRSGWSSTDELREAAVRSALAADRKAREIRWIGSYVLDESSGGLGTLCIYEASSPEAIRDHAATADLPVDEIIAIAETVIVRNGPEHAAVSAN